MYASYCAQLSTKYLIMPTENTSLKNTTPAGDSSTTNEMVIGKVNTYQRTFLIVAGSLLALLVVIAVSGKSGGQYLQSSAQEKSPLTHDIFGVDTEKFAPPTSPYYKDIVGMDVGSDNEEAVGYTPAPCGPNCSNCCPSGNCCSF